MGRFRRMEKDPPRPKRTKLTARERLDWAKDRWRDDLTISVNGKDGMHKRMMDVFSVSVKVEQLHEAKEEVIRELEAERREEADRKEREELKRQKEQAKCRTPVLTPTQREQFDSPRPALVVVKDEVIEMPEKKKPTIPVVPAPGTTRSIDDAKIRYDFARSYLQRNPRSTNADVVDAVREEFGMGIDTNAVGTIKRELGVGSIRRRRTERRRPHPPAPRPKPEPIAKVEAKPPHRKVRMAPEEAIKETLQILLDEVPGLRKLSLVVGDDGKPRVSFDIEVNRVESGEVDL